MARHSASTKTSRASSRPRASGGGSRFSWLTFALLIACIAEGWLLAAYLLREEPLAANALEALGLKREAAAPAPSPTPRPALGSSRDRQIEEALSPLRETIRRLETALAARDSELKSKLAEIEAQDALIDELKLRLVILGGDPQ